PCAPPVSLLNVPPPTAIYTLSLHDALPIFPNFFRNDFMGTSQSFFCRLHFFLHIYKFLCFLDQWTCWKREDPVCRGFQSYFLGNRRIRTTFLFERTVQIIHLLHFFCLADVFFKFRCQFPLLFNDRQNIFFALFQLLQILVAVFDFLDLHFIQRPRCFFSIPGNKWNGVAFFQKRQNRFCLLLPDSL